MDGFLQASFVARRLSDIYSLISSPVTFLFRCETLRIYDCRTLRSRFGEGTCVALTCFDGILAGRPGWTLVEAVNLQLVLEDLMKSGLDGEHAEFNQRLI